MTIEEKLKDLILERYASIRDFTIKIDMPYSTMDSILKRGVANAKVENVLKICKELRISADALANGEIAPAPILADIPIDQNDVLAIVEATRRRLLKYQELTFNGDPADPEAIGSIIDAMEIGVGMALKKAEKK